MFVPTWVLEKSCIVTRRQLDRSHLEVVRLNLSWGPGVNFTNHCYRALLQKARPLYLRTCIIFHIPKMVYLLCMMLKMWLVKLKPDNERLRGDRFADVCLGQLFADIPVNFHPRFSVLFGALVDLLGNFPWFSWRHLCRAKIRKLKQYKLAISKFSYSYSLYVVYNYNEKVLIRRGNHVIRENCLKTRDNY